jgi:hypothetical protein
MMGNVQWAGGTKGRGKVKPWRWLRGLECVSELYSLGAMARIVIDRLN